MSEKNPLASSSLHAAERGELSDPQTPNSISAAVARLQKSRADLRAVMLPAASPRTHLFGEGVNAFVHHLAERFHAVPAMAILIDAVKVWWERHPLHTATTVAAEASRRVADPIAEKNPLALIGGALVFGALFTLVRPWRWLLRPAVFAGLLPALAARVLNEFPADSLLKMFSSRRSAARGSAADAMKSQSFSSNGSGQASPSGHTHQATSGTPRPNGSAHSSNSSAQFGRSETAL